MKNKAERTPRDRNEKRRLLLNKKNAKEIIAKDSNGNRFYDIKTNATRSGASALTLKLQGLNRRVLAVVLAICLMLGLLPLGWFSLHGKAEGLDGLLPVTMSVRANGANNYTTADIAPGNIAENIEDADFKNELPSGVMFQKAVMKDNSTGSETEIKAVSKLKDGSGNEKVYYAFDEDATTGTLLKQNQELILVMSAKYLVTLSNTSEEHGRVTTSAITDSETSNFVWGGNNLRIQVVPDQDYAIDSITYTVNGQSRTATVSNNSSTIPANDITGNISIDVSYAPIENYGIYEVQYMPNSKYYPNLYQIDNQGGLTTGKTRNDNGANETTGKLKNTPTGQDAVFYLYSKSNTGGTTHVLNMLSINGVDINFPAATGSPVPTDFGNNRTITVEMKETRAQLVWNGDTSGSQQYRTYYEIIIPDVHEDLEVALNFKEREDQQIIIKGLRGISQTGAAVEKAGADRYLHLSGAINDSWFGGAAIGTRNYVKTTSKNNIYNAYYNQNAGGSWSGWIPSNNYYIYQVKPGYNPYSVKGQNLYAEYYDQDGALIERVAAEDLLAGESTADRPDVVIKKAAEKVDASVEEYVREQFSALGEFGQDILIYVLGKVSSNNSEIRFWGSSTDADLINGSQAARAPRATVTDWNPSAEDLILTSIKKEETADPNVRWYAIALNQNEAKNQQLYMNAVPFNYSLQLDTLPVNDVTFSTPSGYTNPSNNIYLETAKHTVEDNQAYIVTPTEVPTRTGYVFEGWQLDILNGAGTKVGTQLYQSNEQVVFTDDVLRSGVGDPETSNDLVLPLKAVWTPILEADTTKVRSTVYYQDLTPKGTSATIDETVYNVEFQSVETQTTGEYVAFLNTHEPAASKYYSLNVASHLEGYVQAQQSETDYNEFTAIYDLKFVDFSLKKEVNGNISASQFDITLTLTRPADYPTELSNQDVLDYITYTNTVSGDENNISAEIVGNTIVFSKTFKDGDSVAFTSLPYGWDYTVAEARSQSDNFDTIINTEGKVSHTRNSFEGASYTGTLEENTDVTVNNQRAFDDPNIVSDKWLEKDANGTYKLTMETYATGKEVSDEDAEAVPLDIALVIDQSAAMGTADMNPSYTATQSQNWTVDQVTGQGTTYFVEDGGKYYPVQAEEGTIYQPVSRDPQIMDMKGWGHDTAVINGTNVIGSVAHFNVPTDYYCLDGNGKAHKVYLITAGELLEYASYAYYYTDNNYVDKKIYTSNGTNNYSTDVVNEENPYNNGEEWTDSIQWFGAWGASDIYKTTNDDLYRALGGTIGGFPLYWHTDSNYVTNATLWTGSPRWMSLAYNGQVCFVGRNGATITDCDAVHKTYSWISDGNTVSGLYLPVDGTTYNKMYYVVKDENGNSVKKPLGNQVYTADQTAYSGKLYTVTGESRVSVLQTAANQFVDAVKANAEENSVNHRIAIVGFAGNKFPTVSSGTTAYNTTTYDFTNAGLFIDGGFKNYQTLKTMSSTSDRYINMHYYTSGAVNDGIPSGVPVTYKNGAWLRLGTNTSYSETFYEPNYDYLSSSDYQNALETVTNTTDYDYLKTAINNFSHYGGSYTSYGMTMANNIFENNTKTYIDSEGVEQQRARVIVVFTCGEPGGNGYSDSIAGEALVDGNRAKYANDANGYDASVYTIGLYPGNATEETETFMRQLSSQFTVPVSNVYGGANNGVSESGSGSLDGTGTYYFTDTDGKTLAVTTQKDGLSTLGWWRKTNDGYIRCYPKNASNDSRKVNGESVMTFYNASGNPVYEPDLLEGTVYFSSSSTRNATTAIKYEYRWYDSNNKVRDPIKQAYGTYDTTRNTWQFFALGTPQDTSDGETYYYDVKDEAGTLNAFNSIFETIKKVNLGNAMTLTPDISFVRDVVSDDFEFVKGWSKGSNVSIELVPWDSSNNLFDETNKIINPSYITVTPSNENHTLDVEGFDFSTTYVDNQSNPNGGQKLRVIISGLKPKADSTGGVFDSNTNESGVYKKDWDDEHQNEQKLLDAFPMPSISRYKYTIDVDGDDTNATHATAFELLDGNGNPFPDENDLSIEDLRHDTPFYDQNWSSDLVQNANENNTHSIIFEQINDVVQFETRLSADVFKHSDRVPDDYQVQYTVTGNGMNTDAYTFTKSIDGGASSDYEDEDNETSGVNFTRIMSKDNDTTVDISSEEETVLVNIQEITQAMDPSNDFSDPTKKFDVLITLLDRNVQPAGDYTSGTYVFEDGQLSQQMKHNDSITFEIPKGYRLSIDVQASTQDGYVDSYRENGTDKEGASYTSGQINAYTSIQVINKNDAPTVTGFLDNEKSFGIILGIVAGVSAAAAVAYLYIRRRRGLKA